MQAFSRLAHYFAEIKKSLIKQIALSRTNMTIRGATLIYGKNSVPSAGYKHIPRNSRMRHVVEYSAKRL